MSRTTPARLFRALGAPVAALVALATLSAAGPAAQAEDQAAAGTTRAPAAAPAAKRATIVTPGDFTGYGFDQCLTPDQRSMNAWLQDSPFLAVGIYISGDSRACRNQPNLTPAWVSTQVRNGWRLLPITLGPQASCQPRFPRYSDDFKISPKAGKDKRYGVALRQGGNEGARAVAAAQALGIAAPSTLWYDLEGFDSSNVACRESALSFLSGWTRKLHELGYVSGVYSSAGSGIAELDRARIVRPTRFTLPDRIWVARWDGVANTSTSYIREDGWRPGGRVKQYQGGHDETWGGVRINIDRNFLDLGRGSVAAPETHCEGVNIAFRTYQVLKPPTATAKPSEPQVKALQCLLKERGLYRGPLSGRYTKGMVKALNTWQQSRGLAVGSSVYPRAWITLLSAGPRELLKFGSAGPAVRRVQRALNAADVGTLVRPTGVFDAATSMAVRTYQDNVGVGVDGVVAFDTWAKLGTGQR